jgi:phage repressor protein C with HTH and peptisase S24 domain/DNA-binding XRE family transcriptional regulator
MAIKDKLKLAREALKKTQESMGQTVGVSKRAWQTYEEGKSVPGGNIFDALAKLGFNTNWFFTDDPAVPMMMSRQPFEPETGTQQPYTAAHTSYPAIQIPDSGEFDPSYFDLVPMAEAHLSAGGGAFVLSEQLGEMYSFRKEWLRRVASSPKNVVLMNVRGDSMAPTIKNGDTVLIDTGRRHVYDGNIYAIRLDQTIAIKRLSLLPGNRIMILSDNKAEYPPYNAEAKEVIVIGQVVWLARALMQTDQ